ncbi:integrin beta-7-like [Ctenocephalides felis]|uniref:integrin beta-7-like n=1 Tax=Ctenocephalides felis TaxID=7515 RepID=UPI000E6E31EC|nr:integrin beta-7-like [Ctenocephalides felis]
MHSNVLEAKDYTSQRCLTLPTHVATQCPSGSLLTPITSVNTIQDEPLRKANPNFGKDAVQIRPQRISAKLRVGEEVRFKVQYQQAQDYPVDLYYLMDLSASMEDDKENLSRLASRLAMVMSNITDNFRLGFGSFVDKTAHPYINTSPGKIAKPCTLQSKKPCAPPYSFKHHLSLTSEHRLFEQEVIRAPVSGNLDTPEGWFGKTTWFL